MTETKKSRQAAFLLGEVKPRGLLDFVTFPNRQNESDETQVILDWLSARLAALDAELAALETAIQPSRPKRGKPAGKWFDQGRAYSVWLLAHLVWGERHGLSEINFSIPKYLSTRELVEIAKQRNWDNGPIRPGGAGLFDATAGTLEQSISRGRTLLDIDDGWQSEKCEGIFRKLFEYHANDKAT